MTASLAISPELQITRYHSGIKLTKPSYELNKPNVAAFLKQPFSVFWEDTDGVIQILNESNANFCGFDSVNKAIGKHYYTYLDRKSVQILLKNDRDTLLTKKPLILDEVIYRAETDIFEQTLSIKIPWYSEENKIIGLFGCSLPLQANYVMQSLKLIHQLGFVTSLLSSSEEISLSKQQSVCAHYILKGLKTRDIAMHMGLSSRTVEAYIEHMKNKLNCHNKTELILKLSDMMF